MSFTRALVKPIFQPFQPLIEKVVEKEIERITRTVLHLTPITETDIQDVFVVGYPRSGNTWFQNLISGIAYHLNPGSAPDTLIQELVPDVHQKPYYKRFQTPMFFKSHHLPRPEYKRVIYLLRDGRDAMVSFFHFNRALFGKDVDFMRMVTKGEHLMPCKWHQHVEEWLQNPYASKMIVIQYEKLTANPVAELSRFCDFVGIQRSEELLFQVATQASFSIMRQKEKASGWDNPTIPKDVHLVRRGEVGSHTNEMPPQVLEAFMQEASNTLHKFGYI